MSISAVIAKKGFIKHIISCTFALKLGHNGSQTYLHIPEGCATHYRQKRTLWQIVTCTDKESLSKAGTPIRQH